MSIDIAKRCFEENIRLFGDANTEPEKFNHYNGLFNMAVAIQQLEAQVHNLSNEIDALRRRS